MTDQATVFTSGADQPFFEALLDGQVKIPACAGCSRWHWPAVFHCSACGSWEMVWKEVALEGQIYTWTRTWHKFAGAEAFPPPYVSLVVELSGAPGVRLMGVLEDEGKGFGIGTAVTARIVAVESAGGQIPALLWSIAGGSQDA